MTPPPGPDILSFFSERRSVTGFGVRWEIYNKRDARNASFMRAWNRVLAEDSVTSAAVEFSEDENALLERLDLEEEDLTEPGDPVPPEVLEYQQWREESETALVEARAEGWEALEAVWAVRLEAWGQLRALRSLPEFEAAETARVAFIQNENEAFERELEQPIVSLEYSSLRPLNQPATSNVRFLISKPFSVGRDQEGMLSFNAGVNLYNEIPSGLKVNVGHLRDAQAALQFDIPLSTAVPNRPPLFTLAAYYQYQIEPGIIEIADGARVPHTGIPLPGSAATLLGPKGGIFVAQAKLTFKASDNMVKIPLSLSWANRTELIDAAEVRGNIGFQFDWDSLLGGAE